MIVVDSTVLVDLLRGKATAKADALRRMERDSIPFAVPAICCQELLQGSADEREWRLLHRCLETQEILAPADRWSTHASAARIFFDCRRRGITIRSTIDCLVAQMVLEGDHVLLHDDEDYERIKLVRPLRTYPA